MIHDSMQRRAVLDVLDVELASSCVSAYVLSLGSPPAFTKLNLIFFFF